MTFSLTITVGHFCGAGRGKCLFCMGILTFTTLVTVLVVKKPNEDRSLIYNDIIFGFYNRLVLGGTQVIDFVAFILRPFLRHLKGIKPNGWTSPVTHHLVGVCHSTG